MGCGQSKINLYPRRNKSGGKANGAKKTGAAEKEADEEEGTGGSGAAPATKEDLDTDDDEKCKHLLPLVSHTSVIEVSASQQDFFKMLDEKIDKGKDYDSSSETEVRVERERRMRLIREWQSKSLSQSSSQSQPSPPTPVRRRPPPPRPERERTGSPRKLCSQLASPPPRRCQSAQGQQATQFEHDKKNPVNGARDWQEHNSPVRRPQSAGSNWKGNPKVAPYCQKVNKNDANHPDETTALTDSSGDSAHDSQITYNPTFQTHSPAHALHKNNPLPQQPYITQIVSYPTVNPAPPNAYISPPETYQDSPPLVVEPPKYANVGRQTSIPPAQSNIYYIHGNPRQPSPEQLLTQKQQTALHLQHYVAMKQAQQNMFGYLQRMPHGICPAPDFPHQPLDLRSYDSAEESYGVAYYAGYRGPQRPRSAPPSNNNMVRSTASTPPNAVNPLVGMSPLVNQVSMFTHVTPVMPPYGQFPPGQFPQTEVQYYHQAQLMQSMYRPGSAGSAGTLTRYPAKDKHCAALTSTDGPLKSNECQSINIVRQKAVGQIISLGGQDLGVYQNANEKPLVSPGGGSAGSVSPGADSVVRPPEVAPRPAAPVSTPAQRPQMDGANQKCASAKVAVEKTKKSNGGAVKSRTKILKNSKSVDSKKD